MILNSNKTVREVVLELPQATRVFERLKIDYCCGGDRSLSEACATAGVEVANLERLLQHTGQDEVQGNGEFDSQKASLGALIDHILDKHHVYIRRLKHSKRIFTSTFTLRTTFSFHEQLRWKRVGGAKFTAADNLERKRPQQLLNL